MSEMSSSGEITMSKEEGSLDYIREIWRGPGWESGKASGSLPLPYVPTERRGAVAQLAEKGITKGSWIWNLVGECHDAGERAVTGKPSRPLVSVRPRNFAGGKPTSEGVGMRRLDLL
jgi:hypothetical protein